MQFGIRNFCSISALLHREDCSSRRRSPFLPLPARGLSVPARSMPVRRRRLRLRRGRRTPMSGPEGCGWRERSPVGGWKRTPEVARHRLSLPHGAGRWSLLKAQQDSGSFPLGRSSAWAPMRLDPAAVGRIFAGEDLPRWDSPDGDLNSAGMLEQDHVDPTHSNGEGPDRDLLARTR